MTSLNNQTLIRDFLDEHGFWATIKILARFHKTTVKHDAPENKYAMIRVKRPLMYKLHERSETLMRYGPHKIYRLSEDIVEEIAKDGRIDELRTTKVWKYVNGPVEKPLVDKRRSTRLEHFPKGKPDGKGSQTTARVNEVSNSSSFDLSEALVENRRRTQENMDAYRRELEHQGELERWSDSTPHKPEQPKQGDEPEQLRYDEEPYTHTYRTYRDRHEKVQHANASNGPDHPFLVRVHPTYRHEIISRLLKGIVRNSRLKDQSVAKQEQVDTYLMSGARQNQHSQQEKEDLLPGARQRQRFNHEEEQELPLPHVPETEQPHSLQTPNPATMSELPSVQGSQSSLKAGPAKKTHLSWAPKSTYKIQQSPPSQRPPRHNSYPAATMPRSSCPATLNFEQPEMSPEESARFVFGKSPTPEASTSRIDNVGDVPAASFCVLSVRLPEESDDKPVDQSVRHATDTASSRTNPYIPPPAGLADWREDCTDLSQSNDLSRCTIDPDDVLRAPDPVGIETEQHADLEYYLMLAEKRRKEDSVVAEAEQHAGAEQHIETERPADTRSGRIQSVQPQGEENWGKRRMRTDSLNATQTELAERAEQEGRQRQMQREEEIKKRRKMDLKYILNDTHDDESSKG